MSYRPAGMEDLSDGDFDDEDGFSLAENVHSKKVSGLENNKKKCQPSDYDLHLEVLTACMTGNLSPIDSFLDAGHDVNAFLSSGWTLLLYASNALLPDVIKHLLKRGANPNKHKDGYSPLMAVCDSPHGKPDESLECISILLEAKADPNAMNKDRRTALMFACKLGHPEVILKLLEQVENIDAVDNDGRSAIFDAVTANRPEIVKILISHKASVNLKDRRDLTIQEIASTKGFDHILEMLEFEEEEIENFCPVAHVSEWRDAFPGIKEADQRFVNVDVAAVLYALGLERYRPLFKGMQLKEFLQLTDRDLVRLGMDLQYHRKVFLNGLMQFHTRRWSHLSLGSITKTISHTLYDGITALGNVARQISVIGSSFHFITMNISQGGNANEALSEIQKREFKDELKQTEETLGSLRKDLNHMLNFAKKIQRESVVPAPPDYIGPDKKKRMATWPIILGVTVMAGFYLSKTGYSTKLWN
ncbi:ankyrin repeat, SAM and basic leucine zipper domain-containing protein 1 isoform X2 [Fopius arisanus]|uniref:Ankyrin repeat, SAM and basic leucine zipper domain-containing protein 1 isoform X2 n=1 Tax=Fopius arisanus TaxID=64838 RepID=A0A9R1TGA3_9HYME|nr:PREDICTED: ankyrin repeat, SAM and basic leucine zipper domain-containing protein 1 isoform X2 [Fopius arisanus]